MPVPQPKLEICWWICSFGLSILQISSVGWDISVAVRLQFHSCNDFCSKSQKTQTVWVSSTTEHIQCTTLWAVWSLTESFSLMNFFTSAPLSPPLLCTWFQDAPFQVSSLGSCAIVLAMWDTVCMWGSTTSFNEIHLSHKKCHWFLVLKHKLQNHRAM